MRSPYVKVIIGVDPKTNLSGAKVVGQGADYLLLERPAPKERKPSATPRKKRATVSPRVTPSPSIVETVNG